MRLGPPLVFPDAHSASTRHSSTGFSSGISTWKGRTAASSPTGLVMVVSFPWIALLQGNDRSILLAGECVCALEYKVLQSTKPVEQVRNLRELCFYELR